MIGIIDYGMGNLKSVFNAISFLGLDAKIVTSPLLIVQCDKLILPGVGAYAMAMQNLEAKGFSFQIKEYVRSGKPLLGICLGMQMLSSSGDEPVKSLGLDIIPGNVSLLQVSNSVCLPHVGWNSIDIKKNHPIFEGVRKNTDVYFVHSYCFKPNDTNDILCETTYEEVFTAAVARENVVGLQFHPEKSQVNGLKILENFCMWDGRC